MPFVPTSSTEGIYKEKGSRFIGLLYPVRKESAIEEILSEARRSHPKARHHCWAFRLGLDEFIEKCQDDGEPSGTAGLPILNQLKSSDISNVIVIIVRYFGGTLLGKPGLIRSYKSATLSAIENAELKLAFPINAYRLTAKTELLYPLIKLLKNNNIRICNMDLYQETFVEFEIPKTEQEKMMYRLSLLYNGDGEIWQKERKLHEVKLEQLI